MHGLIKVKNFPLIIFCCLIGSLMMSCERIKNVDDRDSNIKRARDRRAVGDFNGALDFYDKALQRRPGAAFIHWEMAAIYDQHLTNDVRAIYHYERFLELDPKTERRPYAEQLLAAAKLSYAASLPVRPNEAVQEIARLRKELDVLRNLLAEERERAVRITFPAVSTATRTVAVSEPVASQADKPRPEPAKAVSLEPYVVQPGDTLSRIASKMYNDPNKWNIIFEANRTILTRPENVRVGQTLMIPK
ncbi:MAG TPA: LysM peptidoglycan-binding domain-containing protein [Kiritimatiellia bacterium]|nr:LysM peptidoglycan-binding domain-containing protein [Kiritimatiellia bacterium]